MPDDLPLFAASGAKLRFDVSDQRIVCGDCLDVLPGLPQASIDVVVTSPPYNLGLTYRAYDDRREEEDYLAWMLRVAVELRRVMRPDGSFFLNIAGSPRAPWLPFELIVRLRGLFVLQNHIIWVKSITVGDDTVGHFKPVAGQRFLHHNHEHIFHLTVSGDVQLDRLALGVPFKDKSNIARRGHPRDLRCRGNTWFIPYETVQSRAEKFHHPGTFPVALPRWCIRLHGRHGAAVLDPFVGTGTTLLAARQEGAHGNRHRTRRVLRCRGAEAAGHPSRRIKVFRSRRRPNPQYPSGSIDTGTQRPLCTTARNDAEEA